MGGGLDFPGHVPPGLVPAHVVAAGPKLAGADVDDPVLEDDVSGLAFGAVQGAEFLQAECFFGVGHRRGAPCGKVIDSRLSELG